MRPVTIGGAPMSIEGLLAVVAGAPVELAADARDRIAASRAVVDRVLRSGQAVYGINTQVGSGKDIRLSDEEIRGRQQWLVMTHAGGFGPPLPTAWVRAALAARLNGIARGGSGASLAAADTLAAMLNEGVHPLVPSTSSVGAGDVGQMAGMAQVAIGLGRAEYDGEEMSGGDALRRAGIPALRLEAKDGLALVSSNSVSIGSAALVVAHAERTMAAADTVVALSMVATNANPSITLPLVAEAKPIPGQIAAAASLRHELDGSQVLQPGTEHSVQDALSFRVTPQVHGALREYVTTARGAVGAELNAASDNPLVSIDEQTIVSNGNFHVIVLAIAFDALRVAIAHVGLLSDRRMSHLWGAFMQRMATGQPSPDALATLIGVRLRYSAAAAVAELKQLAAPATLDVPPLDLGVEDHGTGAPLSVTKAAAALDLLDDVLAIELLMARDVLSVSAPMPTLGTGTSQAVRVVDEAKADAAQPTPDAVHAALRERFPARAIEQ